MIRGLRYWIQFATGNELTLVHEMTLDEDKKDEGLHESFSIEGAGVHGADFTPAQLALLHCAIREMGRMSESLHMTLLDGEQPEPAPDEAPALNRAEKEILRALAHGDALWLKNDRAGLYGAVASIKEESIKSLWDARLIGPGDEPANMVDGMEDGLLWYTITDLGRRALAAQTPEGESEKPLSGTALDILRGMAGGCRLLDAIESAFVTYETSGMSFSREPFGELRNHGLVCVTEDAGDGLRYYAISAEGVDFLADQAPS